MGDIREKLIENSKFKNITIGEPRENRKIGFYVDVEFMHGDGDGYADEQYGPFENTDIEKAYLMSFLTMLDNNTGYALDEQDDDNGLIALWLYKSSPEDIPDYATDEMREFIKSLRFDPCTDAVANDGRFATLNDYSVSYFDGDKWYRVEIER